MMYTFKLCVALYYNDFVNGPVTTVSATWPKGIISRCANGVQIRIKSILWPVWKFSKIKLLLASILYARILFTANLYFSKYAQSNIKI